MSAEQKKVDEELSVYGEVFELIEASTDALSGETTTRTFNFKDRPDKERDLTESRGFITSGELSPDCFEFLYKVIIGVACDVLHVAKASGRSGQIPGLKAYDDVRRLYEHHPDFVRKIIEAAFNDAIIRLKIEETRRNIHTIMYCVPVATSTDPVQCYDPVFYYDGDSGYYGEDDDCGDDCGDDDRGDDDPSPFDA